MRPVNGTLVLPFTNTRSCDVDFDSQGGGGGKREREKSPIWATDFFLCVKARNPAASGAIQSIRRLPLTQASFPGFYEIVTILFPFSRSILYKYFVSFILSILLDWEMYGIGVAGQIGFKSRQMYRNTTVILRSSSVFSPPWKCQLPYTLEYIQM